MSPGVLVSMKVRAHRLGQKWQRVSSSFLATHSTPMAESMPTKVDFPAASPPAGSRRR